MIVLKDRRILAHDIDTAHQAGERLRRACDIAGIDERRLCHLRSRGNAR
jgi:putative transposase